MILIPGLAALALAPCALCAHDDPPAATSRPIVQSKPGENAWNVGSAPKDWYEEIRRYHGHVGPWNVLGWRIGMAALRELHCEWGKHAVEVVCYVPLQTPFTCLVDGLSIGTGNSLGRLDLRLAEVLAYPQSFVAIRRKGAQGDVLEFRPHPDYLRSIIGQPLEKLEALSQECAKLPEEKLFTIKRISP